MRPFFLSLLFLILTFNSSFGQTYGLGIDYSVMLYYPEDYRTYQEPFVLKYGLLVNRNVSLKSNVALGMDYYQTNVRKNDSVTMRSKYIEVPVYLKVHFSMFDRIFKGHTIFGTGFNLLLSEKTSTKYKNQNETALRQVNWKPEAVNVAWGLGFDFRLNKSFYLSLDGILKLHYLFRTEMNDTGDKLALIPLTKAGIFVWLN